MTAQPQPTPEPAPAPPPGVERRADHLALSQRLTKVEQDMTALRDDVATNTTLTQQVRHDTAEMVELFRSVQGAFVVLEKLGRMARPVGWLAAAVASVVGLWSVLKGGGPRG